MAAAKYKKSFWIFISSLALVFFIGIAAGIGYLIRYSGTSEKVCAQCHPDLIPLWENSSGHPAETTNCFECHSKDLGVIPGNWNFFRHMRDFCVPPAYTADDELTSQRCLDCHADVLVWGYQVKKQVIHFNHRIHREEGLDCIDCHRAAGHVYMKNATNRPTVLECVECHFREFDGPPKNQDCMNCHDVMLAPGRKKPQPQGLTDHD